MGFRKARREVPSRTEVQREAREMESMGRVHRACCGLAVAAASHLFKQSS